jgi:hypothetical protein
MLDGTPISRDDIYDVRSGTNLEDTNVEKTYGKPFHTIPTEGEKELTIVIKGQSKGQSLFSNLIKERQINAQYHNISLYDGIQTTQQFVDCLLKNYDWEINKDTGSTVYTYIFSALSLNVFSYEV